MRDAGDDRQSRVANAATPSALITPSNAIKIGCVALVTGIAFVALVAADDRQTSRLAASLFAVVIGYASLRAAAQKDFRKTLSLLNALNFVVWLWGATVMFAVYFGLDINWQHGWQYATLMLLMAAVHAVQHVKIPHLDAAGLTSTTHLGLAQGAVAAAALGYIIYTGKLFSEKGDWPANIVFITGTAALIAIASQIMFAQREPSND